MDEKRYKNFILKNLDAYYLAIDAFFEFPEIRDHEVGQLIYDEFGYERFSKNTFFVSVLVGYAKSKYESLYRMWKAKRPEGVSSG